MERSQFDQEEPLTSFLAPVSQLPLSGGAVAMSDQRCHRLVQLNVCPSHTHTCLRDPEQAGVCDEFRFHTRSCERLALSPGDTVKDTSVSTPLIGRTV